MEDIHFRDGYVIRDQFATHFLTFTICGWIDLFTRKVYKDIVVDAFKHTQRNNQLLLNAYVIMSNHIHSIARANDRQRKGLSDIVRDFKKYTHHAMLKEIQSEKESRKQWMLHQFKYYGRTNPRNESMQIWTNDNHPEECFGETFTRTKLNYLHQNPVRAGIVENQEDYLYSSAANYAGRKGLLEVELL
jgi:putative transposase